MPHKKTRLKDIAVATGFSVNTVSKALKNSPIISEPTKALIREKARETGYIGDGIAGALRSGETKTIAVILGDISNPHFSIMIKEIEHRVRENGYSTFILNTEEDTEIEYAAIVSALNKKVDGIILCPSQQNTDNILFLKKSSVPFVLIGRRFHDIQTDYVICDDRQGGFLITEHLLKLGHKRIAFFGGSAYISSTRERLRGYQDALFSCGVPFNPDLVFELPLMQSERKDEIVEKLLRASDCTAIFAFSDLIAWEIITCLQEQGRRIPEDISVVGFDNIQSKFSFPFPLTSVSISKSKMSVTTAEILLDRIKKAGQKPQDQKDEYRQIVIPTDVVVRGSSRKV